jgi:hypothetical protein
MPIGKWKVRAEILRNLTEVMALVAAGTWAIWHFWLVEKPTLEPRLQVDSNLQWLTRPLPDQTGFCLAQFGVDVKNIGKVAVDIKTAHIQGWIIKSKPAEGYVDLTELVNGAQTFVDKSFTEEAINNQVGHYPIDSSMHNDYEFVMKKAAGVMEAVFSFEATTADGKQFQTYAWDDLCAQPEKPSSN